MPEREFQRGGAALRALKWIAIALGVVVLLLVALVFFLDSDAVSNRVKALVVPKASAALGRELTVETAKLDLLPNPRVRLGGTALAGRPGEPPLAKLESLDVELGLWPLVRSFGKEIRVNGLALVRPELNLVRAADGTWNFEGLGGAPAEPAPAEPAPAPGGEPVRFAVQKATLTDGALRVVDRSAGRDDAAVALTKIDAEASGGPGAPVSFKMTAALAGAEKNLELALDSPLLPADLAAGGWPELTGRFALKALQLSRLRGFLPADVTAMTRGGRVDLSADVKSADGGYRVDGKGALADLRLKGEPASGRFALAATAKPGGAARVEIRDLAVKGPGVDLGGSATLETEPIRATFALKGPLLDLGTVLGLAPQGDPKAAPAEPLPEGALLPPAMQAQVASVAVRGTIDIDKVVNGKLTATGVKGRAVLQKGVLVLEQAQAQLYGGRVEASGTQVHLTENHPRWNLKAKLDAVDLGNAMESITGKAPLLGKLTGSLDLAAAGADWEHVKRALTGAAALSLADGALTTTDLGDQALAAVSKGLALAGRGGASEKVAGFGGGKTTLRDLAGSFTVKDGFMALAKPLGFKTDAGTVQLGGKVGLSQELALEGALSLSKQLLDRAGATRIPGLTGLDVPLALGGTFGSPSVRIAAEQAIAGAAKGAAKAVVQEKTKALQEDVKKRAEEKAKDFFKGFGK